MVHHNLACTSISDHPIPWATQILSIKVIQGIRHDVLGDHVEGKSSVCIVQVDWRSCLTMRLEEITQLIQLYDDKILRVYDPLVGEKRIEGTAPNAKEVARSGGKPRGMVLQPRILIELQAMTKKSVVKVLI